MAKGVKHSFRGGYLLECGCLFEEIQYVTVFFIVDCFILCFTLRLKWLSRGKVQCVVECEKLILNCLVYYKL